MPQFYKKNWSIYQAAREQKNRLEIVKVVRPFGQKRLDKYRCLLRKCPI